MATVKCPSCQATYTLKEGVREGATLVCKRCGTRFPAGGHAAPAPHAAPHGASHEQGMASARLHRRQGKDNSPLALALLAGVFGVVLIVVLAIVVRRQPLSYAELKQRLGYPADGSPVKIELDESAFVTRLGNSVRKVPAGVKVYVYCDVKEGEVEFILDRGAWQAGRARVLQMRLK